MQEFYKIACTLIHSDLLLPHRKAYRLITGEKTMKNIQQPSQKSLQAAVNDQRYVITLEYCGTHVPRYVVRFCDTVVCIEPTETKAIDFTRIAQQIRQSRL